MAFNLKKILEKFDFIPREYQQEALEHFWKFISGPKKDRKACLYMILVWHRRSGKDMIAWMCLLLSAIIHPGEYYYLFPETGQGAKNLFGGTRADGKKYIEMIPSVLVKGINKNTREIQLVTGSVIRFTGTNKNQVENLRGFTPQGVVVSEAAYHPSYVWEVIDPGVEGSRGFIIMESTVNGENWFWDTYKLHKKQGHYTSLLTIDDTGWIGAYRASQEMIADKRAQYCAKYGDDLKFKQEYYNDVSAGAFGAILHDKLVEAKQEQRVGVNSYDNHYPVHTYWDLGADGTAVWFCQKIGNRHILIDYEEIINGDVKEYVTMLAEKGYRYGTHFFPHDAANKDGKQKGITYKSLFLEQFRINKISDDVFITAKPPNEATTIMAARNIFRRVMFDAVNCEEGLRRLDLVHRSYDKEKKTYSDKVVHDENSHGFQAFGILAYNANHDAYNTDLPDMGEFSSHWPQSRPANTGGIFD